MSAPKATIPRPLLRIESQSADTLRSCLVQMLSHGSALPSISYETEPLLEGGSQRHSHINWMRGECSRPSARHNRS